MSRIDEALKRLTGAHRESRITSTLERFAAEASPKREERTVASFVAAGPQRVELKPTPAPQMQERRTTVTPAAPPAPAAAATPPRQTEPPVEPESTPDEDRLVDVRQFIDYTGFVVGAVRRHAVLIA